MLYFNSLPQTFTPDDKGNILVLTNLLTRAKLMEEMKNNPMLFYKYIIQEGDTPEIVADKYYRDPNRFWMVLYSNEIMDPLWGWPLTQQQFELYINDKYAAAAQAASKTPFEYTSTTVHSYEKIIETTDNESLTSTTKNVTISESVYNSLTPGQETYKFLNGTTCTIRTDKRVVTIYDYEYEQNEAKREIKLLNSVFADQMEQRFQEVMSK